MPLSLPDVTLCAVTSINHDLTVHAMNKCLEHCSFADVIMISSQPVGAPFRVEVVPPFNGAGYAPFIFQNLAKYTSSAFNLLVQYDGYIIEPLAWNNRFLDYDYIGAKWPWHIEGRRVGNSGFCLRSKKLLNLMADMCLPPTGEFVDDKYICHTMRELLETKHHIKIAEDEVADLFAYERHVPDQPTFGFHGLFNFWRHTDDVDMEKMLRLLDNQYVPSRAFAEVLFRYYDSRKFRVFHSGYARLREHIGIARMKDHLLQYLKDGSFIDALIRTGEKLPDYFNASAKIG
jgi:hypothetical protein